MPKPRTISAFLIADEPHPGGGKKHVQDVPVREF
jgi:hypothetical protein